MYESFHQAWFFLSFFFFENKWILKLLMKFNLRSKFRSVKRFPFQATNSTEKTFTPWQLSFQVSPDYCASVFFEKIFSLRTKLAVLHFLPDRTLECSSHIHFEASQCNLFSVNLSSNFQNVPTISSWWCFCKVRWHREISKDKTTDKSSRVKPAALIGPKWKSRDQLENCAKSERTFFPNTDVLEAEPLLLFLKAVWFPKLPCCSLRFQRIPRHRRRNSNMEHSEARYVDFLFSTIVNWKEYSTSTLRQRKGRARQPFITWGG